MAWENVPGSDLPDSTGCALSIIGKILAGALGVLALVVILLVIVAAGAYDDGKVVTGAIQDTAETVDFNNPGGCIPCGAAYVLPLLPLLPKGVRVAGRLAGRLLTL